MQGNYANMKRKLIKGVIYDDQDMVQDLANENVSNLCLMTISSSTFYDQFIGDCECPNKEQFVASTIIDSICNPEDYERNFIIPSILVDEQLSQELAKIDIGKDLYEKYINASVDLYNQSCEDEQAESQEVETTKELEDELEHVLRTIAAINGIEIPKDHKIGKIEVVRF